MPLGQSLDRELRDPVFDRLINSNRTRNLFISTHVNLLSITWSSTCADAVLQSTPHADVRRSDWWRQWNKRKRRALPRRSARCRVDIDDDCVSIAPAGLFYDRTALIWPSNPDQTLPSTDRQELTDRHTNMFNWCSVCRRASGQIAGSLGLVGVRRQLPQLFTPSTELQRWPVRWFAWLASLLRRSAARTVILRMDLRSPDEDVRGLQRKYVEPHPPFAASTRHVVDCDRSEKAFQFRIGCYCNNDNQGFSY